MKKLFYLTGVLLLLTLSSCSGKSDPTVVASENHVQKTIAALNDPKTDYVIVVAHRGDWRNYPENSIAAIESVIRQGVDIMELDIKMTKDSVLVLCHDGTIDRTTTGKGRVSELTYEYINSCFLRSAHNCETSNQKMPTLKEALEVCKDRIVVNIDQGFNFYDQVMAITEELGVTNQILIKGKKNLDEVEEQMAKYENNMMYMPIIDINKPSGQELFKQYTDRGVVPLAYEICWSKNSPEVEKCMQSALAQGSKIWVNTLWASLCGGEDGKMYDDYAYDHGMETYQKTLDLGASLIQTDRSDFLLEYLRKVERHD